jgi:hypothetical protein
LIVVCARCHRCCRHLFVAAAAVAAFTVVNAAAVATAVAAAITAVVAVANAVVTVIVAISTTVAAEDTFRLDLSHTNSRNYKKHIKSYRGLPKLALPLPN